MAEEEIKIEEKSKKRRVPPLKWIIVGIVGVVILFGGILGFVLLKKPRHEASQQTTTSESVGKVDTSANDLSQTFPLEKFVVNLNDPGGKQYLHITIELESTVNGFAEELNSKMPQVKDSILLILSSKSLSDVQGMEGKITLRKELITEINKILNANKIRNLYFTEFVIQ